MKILVTLNNLNKQKLNNILLILISRGKITLEDITKLRNQITKRNELLENYELTPLYNLKEKFGIKKLSKLAELVPYQAFTFDKFMIPKIYESEIEEAIGEHYIPEKRKELEDEIFKEISYLNKFIKQAKEEEKIGRYCYSDYKYIVYLFKHKYLNLYIKNNLEQCKLELQVDKEGRKFLAVTIKDKYKFHLPEDKIFYRKIKNIIPEGEKEYIPSDSAVEKRNEEYFYKMYILMDYYLKFVLV